MNSEETYYWRAWMFLVCSHCVFEIAHSYPKWIYFPPITRVAFWVWLLWISSIEYDYLQRGWWDWEPRFRNLGLNTYLRSQSVSLRSLSINFTWALYSIIHFKLNESTAVKTTVFWLKNCFLHCQFLVHHYFFSTWSFGITGFRGLILTKQRL